MDPTDIEFVEISRLRVGHFVELDIGWMSHPFPTNSFKIAHHRQIDTLRQLGLQRVKTNPSKSDPEPRNTSIALEGDIDESTSKNSEVLSREVISRQLRSEQLATQQRDLVACERRFGEAVRQYRKILDTVHQNPLGAAEQSRSVIGGFVQEMFSDGESAIRLLSETAGDKVALHPVNVTIVSLLLGKVLCLSETELRELGIAAFVHDVGKTLLPDRVRWLEETFTSSEYKLYQDHVNLSLELAQHMGLSPLAQQIVSQHHEFADGSGYPAKIRNEAMSPAARILSLVNQYDSLCNPSKATFAKTPHEALSTIFAQQKQRFDTVTLSAFIKMIGVYPPGSVVQLLDERYALVVSVNSSRPLKPRILVHDPGIQRHEALLVDLEREPQLGIRRSLKPTLLPPASLEFLAPRQRINYFFESARDLRSGINSV